MNNRIGLGAAVIGLVSACGPAPAPGGGGTGGAPSGARCDITTSSVVCRSKPVVSITTLADTRRIYWNDPPSPAPDAGWPAVILYQGSIFGPSLTWDVALPRGTTPFGGDHQVELVARLLDAGFLVVQPEAPGGLAWNTNGVAPYETTQDAVFIPKLFAELASGRFGRADMSRLYAVGISSGGYMTSRMAVSYPGRFRALAIQSGSYATCLGPICNVPSDLPDDHPPTLFLHGSADLTVGIATARDYFTKLKANGTVTKFVEDPAVGHAWLAAAPGEVVAWFEAY